MNGPTTAILAHGLHTIYPKENIDLAENILESNGLLFSEYIVGTSALPNYFVERDRLQTYLSDCICIVQTDIIGGTMHAVKVAHETSKKIAVIFPDLEDFLNHPKSRGNEFIINNMGGYPIINKESLEQLYTSIVNKEPEVKISQNTKSDNSGFIKANKSNNNQIDIPFN